MNHITKFFSKAETCQKRLPAIKVFIIIILAFCLIIAGMLLFFSQGRPGSKVHSFAESVMTMSDEWTFTDSSGKSREIQLPYTIEYGKDGKYSLRGVLPDTDMLIDSPAFCFYSNYTDLRIIIDGETQYVYPDSEITSNGATGNTYHFIRLPSDYAGKTIQIELSCQLGDDITYLLKAPLIGSKGTMLYYGIIQSMPSILLSGCMIVLAIVLAIFDLFLKRKLKLNSATAYTSLFAVLFSVYVFCETYFAQLVSSNGYALFTVTLLILALLPIPLFGLFAEEVSTKLRRIPIWLMLFCSVNFVGQAVLHFSGVLSLRVMLPATHITIIISISVMILCLLFSDKNEKPEARIKLISALPMIIGGVLDIFLLMINKPSFNNSFWFIVGVTAFIIIQFISFTRGFFIMYRTSLETDVLRDIAYRDMLTGVGNRNAYERKLKEIAEQNNYGDLCGFVVDINDLKLINDKRGHAAGDMAIVETSNLLVECLPKDASCFRTGGDEFVALMHKLDEEQINTLAQKLKDEAELRGNRKSIPLSIAVGSGRLKSNDNDVLEFIRRIDAAMYSNKRADKSEPSYRFKHE